MYKLHWENSFVLLLLAVILSACAGTTQVDFDPAAEQEQEREQEPEQDREAIPDETADAPPEPKAPPPEVKPYSTDIAGTAEQLYGTDPGNSTNAAYLKVRETDLMLRYTVIYFDFNKSEIKAGAREILSHHARFMQANPEIKLRIEGHADQRGTSGYNLALGESRANAVRTILEAYGVDGSRISAISFGEEQPAIDGNTEEAFKLNRRSELIYL